MVAPAFSRDQVTQYLSAVALADKARKALAETGLTFAADVSVSGIDAPREARLIPAADPAETPDYPSLHTRIRDALRDFHITLGLLQNRRARQEHQRHRDRRVLPRRSARPPDQTETAHLTDPVCGKHRPA
ncbi:hypothetical protein [Streptomyces sp. NPDC093795]|uniref:hypothetical protein n=1 Tax=Streptomyces sp. NPDC093795 TaxID=3366051 RepID=UPI0038000078